ncbi:hypothetical protein ET33_37120 [Paenibacillus tyrfis]|uniref:Uncharacterized protein n=1 Tax=Paenibacillus tyrfis TaxID=1501230 RepID=A0A081P526_9BACL|nr:hypothetical protein ET33_37120 [Paenibacillus tyrfis]
MIFIVLEIVVVMLLIVTGLDNEIARFQAESIFVYGDKEAIERRFRGELDAMRQEKGNEEHVTEL